MKRKYKDRGQSSLPDVPHSEQEQSASEIKKFLAEALRTKPKAKSRNTKPDEA